MKQNKLEYYLYNDDEEKIKSQRNKFTDILNFKEEYDFSIKIEDILSLPILQEYQEEIKIETFPILQNTVTKFMKSFCYYQM